MRDHNLFDLSCICTFQNVFKFFAFEVEYRSNVADGDVARVRASEATNLTFEIGDLVVTADSGITHFNLLLRILSATVLSIE